MVADAAYPAEDRVTGKVSVFELIHKQKLIK